MEGDASSAGLYAAAHKAFKTAHTTVQGMPGVWDVHCQYEAGGTGIGPFPDLVSCSAHGNL